MPGRRDLLIRLDSEFSDKGFKSAESSAKALAKELDRVENEGRKLASMQMAAAAEDKARRQQQLAAMSSVGRGAVAMGAAVAIGLGVSAKAAMDWESAWTGVRKTVDGTAPQMAALEQELRGLAKTLPSTHEEIAGVAEAAGQLGVKRQDVAAFTKTMIDLGETTNLSADEAATGLAQLGNVMGVLPKQADRAGAALVALGNDGASTEADILAMSLRIAGAGKTIGLTQAQVMGFASALSSVGIEAEAGGSAISRVMVDIASSVAEGGDKLDQFAHVAGMSSEEFAQAFEKDAAGAVLTFIEGLGKMEKSGQNVFGVLEGLKLNEIRVRDALLRTANAGDLVRKSVDLGSEAWKKNTALLDEANKRYQTSEARIEMARNKLNDAAIDIGANVLPALAGAADRVGALSEAFSGLSPSTQSAVTALGAIVAGAGLMGGTALIVIPKVHALVQALETMGPRGQAAAKGLGAVGSVLTGPWGLALGAGVLALGIYAESQHRAQQRVEELSATLDKQTGAVTASTREMVKNQLSSKGWWLLNSDSTFDQAEKLGIALDDITDAHLGNEAAIKRVNAQLDDWRKNLSENEDEMRRAGIDYGALGEAVDGVDKSMNRSNGTLDEARDRTRQKAEADGDAADAADDAAESTENHTAAVSAQSRAAEDAKNAIDGLKQSLDVLNGVHLSARDAARAWEASIDAAAKALEDNGKTLDITAEKGRANGEVLDAMAKSASVMAQSILDETGSEEQFRASLAQSREALYQTALRFGMTEADAHAYVDQVLAVPAVAETSVKLTGAQQALDDLARVAQGIMDLPRERITSVRINEIVSRGGNTGGGFADGGLIPGTPSYQDNRIAAVASGEYVQQTAAVQFWGTKFMDDINNMRMPSFATGGLVGAQGGESSTRMVTAPDQRPLVGSVTLVNADLPGLLDAALWSKMTVGEG